MLDGELELPERVERRPLELDDDGPAPVADDRDDRHPPLSDERERSRAHELRGS